MNKNEIKFFIKNQIEGKPPKKQLEILTKLEKFFVGYIEGLKIKISAKYYKCPSCGTYFDKKKIKIFEEERFIRNCLVWTDAGYGDDDQFADRKYKVTYCVCPKCSQKYELSKNCIWQGPLRTR